MDSKPITHLSNVQRWNKYDTPYLLSMTTDDPTEHSDVVISEQFDPDGPEAISLHIVRLVSVVSNRKPDELQPLGEAIDTDALNRLIDSKSATGRRGSVAVSFAYEGYEIDIDANGMVRLYHDA